MFKRLVLTALFVVTGPKPSFAAEIAGSPSSSNSSALKNSTLKAPLANAQPKKPKPANFSVGLTVGQEGYVSRSSESTGTNDYTEVGARVDFQTTPNSSTDRRAFGAKVNAGLSTSTSVQNYTNGEVPEAYGTYTSLDLTKKNLDASQTYGRVDAGRKKEMWSGLDSEWTLGLMQPLNKFDGLRPTEQGLTGAFATFGAGGFKAVAFGSPIFIPEQGAPYQNVNGQFSTSSPWFSAPPDTLILSLGSSPVRSPVNYNLNIPEVQSVVFNSSFGGLLRVSDPDSTSGFFAQVSGLRKPQNALSLAFSGKLTLSDSTTYGDVSIFPEVVYHSIAGADVGYSDDLVTVSLSGIHERPDQPTGGAELTSQQLSPMTIVSPSLEVRPFASSILAPKLRLSYIDTDGGEITTIGKFAANGNVFGPRTMFRQAVSTSFSGTLYRSQRLHLQAGTRWIEELEEQGSIVMTDLRLGIGNSWQITLQGDVLGSRKPVNNTDTFIARYRANDRVAGRVTYLF